MGLKKKGKAVLTPGACSSPMSVMADDFEILTENGKLVDESGEFSAVQFQSMMRGELKRFCQRQVGFGLSVSGFGVRV